MSHQQHDSQALERYRNRAAKVAELREAVGSQLESMKELGADQLAGGFSSLSRQMEELTLRTKELKELSQTLTPKELFLVKYGVLVLGKHTVSFVIPQGTSRMEILEEAAVLAATRPLINPNWSLNEGHTANVSSLERFCICGNVEQLKNKGRMAQEKILEENGLEMPAARDLAVAFAIFWVATGEMLSGVGKSHGPSIGPHWNADESYWVRARDGDVLFDQYGLREYDTVDGVHLLLGVTGSVRITNDTQLESLEAGSLNKRSTLLERIGRFIGG